MSPSPKIKFLKLSKYDSLSKECLYLCHCTYLIFQRPQQQQAPKTKEIATLVKYTRIAVGAKLLIKSSTILCDKMQKNDWKTNFLESKQQKGEQILDESNRDRSSLCYFFHKIHVQLFQNHWNPNSGWIKRPKWQF